MEAQQSEDLDLGGDHTQRYLEDVKIAAGNSEDLKKCWAITKYL